MNSNEFYQEYFQLLGYNPDSFSAAKVLESNTDLFKNEKCYGVFCSDSNLAFFDKDLLDFIIRDSITSLKTGKTNKVSATTDVLSCLSKTFIISRKDIVFLENSVFESFDSNAYESAMLNEKINNNIESCKEMNQEIQNMVHPDNDKKIDVGGMIVGGMIGGTAGAILGGTPTKTEKPRYSPQYTHAVKKEDYITHQKCTTLKYWQEQKIISVTFEQLTDTLFYSLKKESDNKTNEKFVSHPEIIESLFADIEVPDRERLLKEYSEKIDTALSQNDESAMEYVNEALKLDPENPEFWFKKCQATWILSTFGNPLLDSIKEYADNSLRYTSTKEKEKCELTIYGYVMDLCVRIMDLAIDGMNDCKSIKEINNNNVKIYGAWKSMNVTRDADTSNVDLYDSMTITAINTALSISDEAYIHHKELLLSLSKVIQRFDTESDALKKRLKIYGAILTQDSKNTRESIKKQLESKYSNNKPKNTEYLEKKAKQLRETYWKEHAVEKEQLFSKKKTAQDNIENYQKQMQSISEINEIEKLQGEINKLKQELQNISIFKSSDRNKVKARIKDKQDHLSTLNASLAKKRTELETEIAKQEKIIANIDQEFSKQR